VLLRRLAAGGRAVLSGEAAAWPLPYGVERLAPVDDGQLPFLRVPGTHNRRNAAAALSACRAAGVPVETASAGLAAFPGLPHRLQLVREHRGVRWYNDSKSTVPEATLLALDALAPAPVHLIVGGSDKGIDLAPLAELAPRVRSLLCIGQTGERIAAMAGVPPVGTLDAAVARAAREVKPGQAVLLSPGCASFDQFRSFEHRGDRFAELVGALA
jgi:UDP-N-acetylmuramoylalanine--D-glutamate ligase